MSIPEIAVGKSKAPLRLLYVPWIEAHTGALIKLLQAAGDVEFVPLPLLDMIPGTPGTHRTKIMNLAHSRPAEFQQLLAGLLGRLTVPVNALVMTVDWCLGLRHTVQIFRDCGFPTVLVPHESVFAREELYYTEPISGINVPQAEVALLWGGLQADVFGRRGLAKERMYVLGSPKLDYICNYRSALSRTEVCARLGLDGAKPIVLFAMQPLDNQFDTPQALIEQSRAILDCLVLCQRYGWQIVVRLPPARDLAIIAPQVVQALKSSGVAAIDGAEEGRHLTVPEEALFHADAVVSINSTMLLEAGLMQRPSVSLGYVACDQFWHRKGGLPLASNTQELEACLVRAMSSRVALFSEEGWGWIRWAFSAGEFDGNSARRILGFVAERWSTARSVEPVAQFLGAPR